MNCEKAQVLIIHGPVGSGKTSRAKEVAEKAVSMGYIVFGLLSLRVIQEGETVGYNALNLKNGVSFSLVRLRSLTDSDDWEKIGNWKFSFSKEGFKKANEILSSAVHEHSKRKIIVIDEFGHIELLGRGIYQGFKEAINSINEGNKVVILCRTDKLERVRKLLNYDIQVVIIASSDPMFLEKVTDRFI